MNVLKTHEVICWVIVVDKCIGKHHETYLYVLSLHHSVFHYSFIAVIMINGSLIHSCRTQTHTKTHGFWPWVKALDVRIQCESWFTHENTCVEGHMCFKFTCDSIFLLTVLSFSFSLIPRLPAQVFFWQQFHTQCQLVVKNPYHLSMQKKKKKFKALSCQLLHKSKMD